MSTNKYEGQECPFCHTAIRPGDEIAVCDVCGVAHHRSCWRSNGSCTTPSCNGSPVFSNAGFNEIEYDDADERRRRRNVLLLFIGLAIILILLILALFLLRGCDGKSPKDNPSDPVTPVSTEDTTNSESGDSSSPETGESGPSTPAEILPEEEPVEEIKTGIDEPDPKPTFIDDKPESDIPVEKTEREGYIDPTLIEEETSQDGPDSYQPGSAPVLHTDTPMEIGERAPDFTFETIDGEVITLSDYIGEKHVILDFFATWCRPCRDELPELRDFYERYSGDVEIIAISSEHVRSSGTIRDMNDDMELEFPVMHDFSATIGTLYPTMSIPYLVYIDINGIVLDEQTGYNPMADTTEIITEKFGL